MFFFLCVCMRSLLVFNITLFLFLCLLFADLYRFPTVKNEDLVYLPHPYPPIFGNFIIFISYSSYFSNFK